MKRRPGATPRGRDMRAEKERRRRGFVIAMTGVLDICENMFVGLTPAMLRLNEGMGASLRKSGSSDLADNRACGWGASTAFAFSDCVCVGE